MRDHALPGVARFTADRGVFVAFSIVALITSETGYRHGRWWQERTPEEKEGPTTMIVGSLLALMAFLLAITMGMASDRFDTRRGLVLAEANSVGTTYLRAGYLPEPVSSEIRDLLREYVPLRIATNDLADVRVKIARSVELHAQLWSIAEELARTTPESDVLALFIDSLNETIDLHETRVTAGVYARVPSTVLILLLLGSMLTLGMVGYNAGLTRRRSPLTAVVLIVVLGAVITLVVDLDRGRDGFLKVSQQPLIDLQEQIGAGVGAPSLGVRGPQAMGRLHGAEAARPPVQPREVLTGRRLGNAQLLHPAASQDIPHSARCNCNGPKSGSPAQMPQAAVRFAFIRGWASKSLNLAATIARAPSPFEAPRWFAFARSGALDECRWSEARGVGISRRACPYGRPESDCAGGAAVQGTHPRGFSTPTGGNAVVRSTESARGDT